MDSETKVSLLIGIAHGQLARRELWLVQGQFNDGVPMLQRNLVPGKSRGWLAVFKPIDAVVLEAMQPVVESGTTFVGLFL